MEHVPGSSLSIGTQDILCYDFHIKQKKMRYKKYYLWVDSQRFRRFREGLEKKRILLVEETRIPCRVLRPSLDTGVVFPSAWDGSCKRRTSWYPHSEKTGEYLIVSSSLQSIPDSETPTVIMDSDFSLDRLPTFEEIASLVESEEFRKRKPLEWDRPDASEKDFYQRWFERYNSNEPFEFGKILLSHSANHANFLDPRYFVITNGGKAPYSVADSLHICSSCLEFFNILGSQWPVKYVAPCIGAVLFAHLPMDQYFKVETPSCRVRQA